MVKEKETKKTDAENGKSEALKLAIAQITKQFGDGSIMKLGDNRNIDVELLKSGSLLLKFKKLVARLPSSMRSMLLIHLMLSVSVLMWTIF